MMHEVLFGRIIGAGGQLCLYTQRRPAKEHLMHHQAPQTALYKAKLSKLGTVSVPDFDGTEVQCANRCLDRFEITDRNNSDRARIE